MARGRQTGRILPHQRDTDDSVPIIFADAVINEEHAAAVHTTESQGMKPKTRNEYRNRENHLMVFWEHKYPDYFEQGTVLLTDEEKNDPNKYYHKNQRDIRYAGINVKLITAFLSNKKTKPNGNLVHPSDLQKYGDAIKWGATVAGQKLPTEYHIGMDTFLRAYRKEFAEAKSNGKVDEKASDPVNASLFSLICQWALAELNIFVWVFSLLMWHMMARSISISSMALHNIRRGTAGDSLAFKYDNSKTDQSGEFVQEKNCYANPQTPYLCLYLALGCYMSINSESFESTEKLFVKSNTKNNTAAQNYCRQLSALVSRHADAAKKFLRISRFHAHGIRKGSGTHASSATTLPPQFTSVAARGEWSMGKILDIYFQFAMGGDYYLGRLLTLIAPEDELFDSLPPHWVDEEHPTVREGIEITFGKVVSSHENGEHNPIGVLSFLLASMVHHSDWLLEQMAARPDHPFSNIPILNKPELLKELKDEHLTLKPTVAVKAATGIPPFVAQNRLLRKVLDICVLNHEALGEFKSDLTEAVAEAVDAKVSAEGGVNNSILLGQLSRLRDDIREDLNNTRTALAEQIGNSPATADVRPRGDNTASRIPRPDQFEYTDNRGKVHKSCVPASFAFPRGTTRWDGWRKWLEGQVYIDESGTTWKLKPFRHLNGMDLKPQIRAAYHNEWQQIFKRMEDAPGVKPIPDSITEEYIKESYDCATQFLKDNYSYIFTKPDDRVASYAVGTWSKKIKYSEVLKHGTEEDKQKLPPPTANNNKRKSDGKERTTRNPRRFINRVSTHRESIVV
ncbi:hypothetical protein QTG54_002659 [Skeletonema marinoi]|uniref:Uncharacterized protein n=1 Tax=Skeletonema marinoi TaxID=267567 RepID=A0AAD9DG88_9STRA|nr:hypothetical protein QTG54_002659 [Skeletonema marinoi]